jgi:hypothetical protein
MLTTNATGLFSMLRYPRRAAPPVTPAWLGRGSLLGLNPRVEFVNKYQHFLLPTIQHD